MGTSSLLSVLHQGDRKMKILLNSGSVEAKHLWISTDPRLHLSLLVEISLKSVEKNSHHP